MSGDCIPIDKCKVSAFLYFEEKEAKCVDAVYPHEETKDKGAIYV